MPVENKYIKDPRNGDRGPKWPWLNAVFKARKWGIWASTIGAKGCTKGPVTRERLARKWLNVLIRVRSPCILLNATWKCPFLARTGNNKVFVNGTALAQLFPGRICHSWIAGFEFVNGIIRGRSRVHTLWESESRSDSLVASRTWNILHYGKEIRYIIKVSSVLPNLLYEGKKERKKERSCYFAL
jgi:hypothetical protein